VAVNLNFTSGRQALESAIQQAGLDTVITSRVFMEKVGSSLPALPGVVCVEDLLAHIGWGEKLRAGLYARFGPARCLAGARRCGDDTAAVIFSSGSTGEPKGVMLSHHNVLANCESVRLVLRPRREDVVCATLPLFHSFGYTSGIWFALLSGIEAAYHPSPLEAARVGEMVRDRKGTALFSTPTFLASYIRKIDPEHFRTLRIVVAGAEKLKPRLAAAFQEKFGVAASEGYGATELSPVAALNLPDADVDGIYQSGHKEGSVGQPIPGVAVRIVDPESGEPLSPGKAGLMLIRGPNVMKGYLGRPDLTDEVIRDNWYHTGDIASVDEEGFIIITDRLSRFSKIGGEMVPHVGIEDALHAALHTTERVLAVTSIPDEKRGERVALLYTDAVGSDDHVAGIIAAADIPNLWKPDPRYCFRVKELPILGSGKLDLAHLKTIAAEAVGGEERER
jgi:acyl-[acyl-carrier-protein]-phospholipid O-acyltransferase/long-chain-fatty-acid--[acyl-carrier-protein] ligase